MSVQHSPTLSPKKVVLRDVVRPILFKEEIKEILTSWKVEQQDHLNHTLREQSKNISKLSSDVAEVKQQNLEIKRSNMEIEKAMAFINKQYEDIKKQIETLQTERQLYLYTISELEKKVIDIQQISRNSSIEIRNVPITEGESTSDLNRFVSQLSNVLEMPISGVRDIYRIPGKPGTKKAIVVELNSMQEKDKVLTATKKFNKDKPHDGRLNTSQIGIHGHPQPVYVAEFLPSSTKKLFHLAREFAKLYKYEFCWSINGKVFLRQATGMKHIHVKSEQFLCDLKQ
ncbi:unnamed protein product [Arctia plantaginis]|uniref:FP protein C-terminal domain-containing protein n=1 Tax=Arctia plantaginis TaxID=874455 RepID=A0A8S1AHB7_ARCPL|nr:unnamed protein product [Arctia plantaginis]